MTELITLAPGRDHDAKLFANTAFPVTTISLLEMRHKLSGDLFLAIVEDDGLVNLSFQVLSHLRFHFADYPSDAPIILLFALGLRLFVLNFTKVL